LANAGGPLGNAGGPLGNVGGQSLNQETVPSNSESRSSEVQRGRGTQRGRDSQIDQRGRQSQRPIVYTHSSRRSIGECLSPSRISPYRLPIPANLMSLTLDPEEMKVITSSYARCRNYFFNMSPNLRRNFTEKELYGYLRDGGLHREEKKSIKLK
jgi:hypothetical protein